MSSALCQALWEYICNGTAMKECRVPVLYDLQNKKLVTACL